MTIDWTTWKPRLLYGAFALAAFVLSLRLTFPANAVKERIVYEAGAQGWHVEMGRLSAAGVLGLHAHDVVLESRTGMKIPIDELTADLKPLPLLIGQRVLAFDARLAGGRVEGSAGLSGDRAIKATVASLDLSQALGAHAPGGLALQGKADGDVDLVLGAAADAKPSGTVDLTVTGLDVAGAQLPIPGMSTGFPLPRLALGTVTASVSLEAGKATAKKLQARGGDAEATADGAYVVLQPRLEYAPVAGAVQLRIQPAFWSKPETSAFRGIAESALAASRTPDGAYAFQLYGSLAHPQLRPAPNPQ